MYCISYSSLFQHQLSRATIIFGVRMSRRCAGLYKQSNPRSSEQKVHPEPLWIYQKVLLSHSFSHSSRLLFLSERHSRPPIQNRRQRAHTGSSVLSWLQIRLCVITLFSYGKHMTMKCSTIGLGAYLRMCVCVWLRVHVHVCSQWQHHRLHEQNSCTIHAMRITLTGLITELTVT